MACRNNRIRNASLSILAALVMPAILGACSLVGDLFFGPLYSVTVTMNDSSAGTYSISSDAKDESKTAGEHRFREGSVVTLSALPAGDFQFDSWSGEFQPSWEPELTFTVTRDADLTLNFATIGDNPWLVLVYMAAANDLEAEGLYDFNQIERGLFDADPEARGNRKVVVLFDRMAGGNDDDGDWTGTRLYEASPDDDASRIASTVIQSAATPSGMWRSGPDDEEAMGNRDTLAYFVDWAAAAYPEYGRHALVLWNHGSGLLSNRALSDPQTEADAPRSVCFDDETKTADGYGLDGQLFIGELQEALAPAYGASNMLEVIGFDACYMGSYEVAYEFRDIANYFVGSPAEEYGGWNYASLFSESDAFVDGRGFVREVVMGYQEKSLTAPNTMTGVDLSVMEDLKTAVDKLATALATESQSAIEAARDESTQYFPSGDGLYFPYHDIGSLCEILSNEGLAPTEAQAVRSALGSGVVYTWTATDYGSYVGTGIPNGLSIFFSHGEDDYSYYYTHLDTNDEYAPGFYYGHIDAADSDGDGTVETWRELLEYLYDNPHKDTPGSW